VSLPEGFENRQPDASVNVSDDDRIAFGKVILWFSLSIGIVLVLIFASARYLIPMTPYAWEQKAFESVPLPFEAMQHPELARIERMVEQLTSVIALPPGMKVSVAVVDEDAPNAFATLAGRMFVTRGLLERVESENELAMVLAHEIAHLAHRDPAAALGAQAMIALLSAAVGLGGEGAATGAAAIGFLAFSRSQEERADEIAIDALKAVYGHAGGADAFFRRVAALDSLGSHLPQFLSTHPSDEGRIRRIEAAQAGWDPVRQPLKPWRAVQAERE
jgi:predicted Zn-dependent protease